MLYACKGVPGSVKAGNTEHSLDIYGESYGLPTPFSPVRERDKEREREIKRDKERKREKDDGRFKRNDGCLGTF
jgi:hypothetical protein